MAVSCASRQEWGGLQASARCRAFARPDSLVSGRYMLRILSSFAVCSALALAQDGAPAASAEQAPTLPAANSDEARAFAAKALDKLAAYGRGTFSTTESQDQAMLRNAGLPFGATDVEISGGWHRHVVWGEADGREYVTANGRMMAKVDGQWRLRRDKLSGGQAVPFTLDPDYLVTVIKRLPKAAKNVIHVAAGKLRGKAMTLLTIKLDNEDALEFADSGAAPGIGGGFGGMIMFGGMGGMEPPRPELETYIVFYVDTESGDLTRVSIKSYSTDEMMGNIQIGRAAGGGFGGQEELEEEELEEEEVEEEEVDESGEVKWKRGLPRIKPAKDQSVMTFRADFKKLGLAEAPELDDKSKQLLRIR